MTLCLPAPRDASFAGPRSRRSVLRVSLTGLLTLVLVLNLAAKSEPQWGDKLGKTEVVATVTNPANAAERFEITRAILPANQPGPPRRFFADGRWQQTEVTYPEPRAFYGLRDAKGRTFVRPSRTSVFVLPEQGVLFGDFAGEKGDEIHAREFVRWGYDPSRWALFQQEMQERDERGNIIPAKIVPIGVTPRPGLPVVEAVVCLRQTRLQIFDGTTGKQTLDAEPREIRSPAFGEMLPRVYESDEYLRQSKVRYFHLGGLLAFFVDQTLHVLDENYRPVAQYTDAAAQRAYLPEAGEEPQADPWFILRPSPTAWNIFWILQPDGKFAPPPGAIGVQPAKFVVKYPQYSSHTGGPEHHYRVQCHGWLVASLDPQGRRRWAYASADFREVTEPLQTYRRVPSKERNDWWGYRGPVPEYLVLEKADGTCAVLDGATPPSALRFGAEAALVADLEAREKPANAEDPLRARLGAEALAAELAASRRQQQQVYDDAMARGDAYAAYGTARYLGGEPFYAFLQTSLATESMIREAAVDPVLNAEQRRALVARAKAFDEQRFREAEEQRAAAQDARERANAAAAARTRQEWADWSARAAQASSANQRAVQETVYNHAIESYRRGHTDTLPKR